MVAGGDLLSVIPSSNNKFYEVEKWWIVVLGWFIYGIYNHFLLTRGSWHGLRACVFYYVVKINWSSIQWLWIDRCDVLRDLCA